MAEKPPRFVGSSLADLRAFPELARRRAGFELHQVQSGLSPSTETEHRVFYLAKFEEAVYVLHTFEKRAQKTPKRDIDTARARLAQVLTDRARRDSTR